ncbi:MAG: 4Fe-4S binding protein [Bacteroidales bacterium]|jgi:ferredoxin|nr:4Fe-4S binding protein [Bacteroidales bacterium]MCU0409787.1 4Fe-4S binding protein [Bacteroidales bacterium]
MRSVVLRHIRIVFSFIVLLLLSFLFIDFRGMVPDKAFGPLLYLQFIPSMLKFVIAGVATATGFVIILILTVLSGRTYCSFLCPLGILQDVISRIGGFVKRRFRKYAYKKPYTILRYFILALTAGILLIGGVYVLTILDPYSIFGRLMTYFVKPAAIFLNNQVAGILGKFDIYTLYKIDIKPFELAVYAVPAAFLMLIGFLAFRYGRLYCNTVCPVGTFLGFLSKISLFRIRFDEDKCNRCGRCAMSCKSSCIDFLNKHVDISRCVNCFNCLEACHEKAMSYGLVRFRSSGEPAGPDASRRNFIAGSLLMLAGGSQIIRAQNTTTPVPTKDSTIKEDRLYPVSPPGSSGLSAYTSRCTACSLCISACPTSVIQPSVSEFGIAGIMQPRMDFHRGFCNYECTLCTEICPTGAIMPLMLEAKKLTRIGKAVFIKDNCIVATEKTACGACSEHCPTKACAMIPYEGNLLIPEVIDDICIGCGACEYACPTKPYKAIFVDGNPLHEVAKKPETKKMETAPADFPF